MFLSKNHGENETGLKSLKSSILGKNQVICISVSIFSFLVLNLAYHKNKMFKTSD